MTYLLSSIVNVWMGLYYNLPRLRVYGKEGGSTSIEASLEYLASQNRRHQEDMLYWKMREILRKLRENNCRKALRVLEDAWDSSLSTKQVPFSEPQQAISLIDFPRYSGASWPHNDIAIHFPALKKTAVMKISDARFRPLRERLMAVNHGMDPFIGAHFSVAHSKLHPAFNRVRCSRASPIDLATFKTLDGFKDQLSFLGGAYVAPQELSRILTGTSPLDLQRYIIARYGSNYALMQFVMSEAYVVSSIRHPDGNYSIRLRIDGQETNVWMFRNMLFDPVAEPKKYGGKNVWFSGFLLIGRSGMAEYRASMHINSIVPFEDAPSIELVPNVRSGFDSSCINEIEEELASLVQRPKPQATPEEKEERGQLPDKAPRSIPQPPFIAIKEADFEQVAGRVLVILSSNPLHAFRNREIISRLKNEGFRDVSERDLSQILDNLCKNEYVFMNIFGDAWYINPQLRVTPRQTGERPESIEPRIIEFLKKEYPRKIRKGEIAKEFVSSDNRLSIQIVFRALGNLSKSRRILLDRDKCYWNPYPPKEKKSSQNLPTLHAEHMLHLSEAQIDKVPRLLYAQSDAFIEVMSSAGHVERHIAFNFERSYEILTNLLNDMKKGICTRISYKDVLNGRVEIWFKNNRLFGSYANFSRRSFDFVRGRLGDGQ